MAVRYVIYEIDWGQYWSGGTSWCWDANDAMWFKDEYEAEAAMRGLYRRNSDFNLMYRKIYVS